MTLSDISIKNPVFAWMLMAGLIVFGTIGFLRMGISQLPDVDFPVVSISVTWAGASPETMEAAVADIVESAVMSVEGIRNVSSTSQEGQTAITIEFELTRQIDAALQEVQTKLAQAQKNLPNDIDPPIVTKSNPEDQPILWAALSGTSGLRDMILFVRDHLKDNLTKIEGVGDVRLGGYVDPNMRIWLNSEQLSSKEITVTDVIAAISNQHTLAASGFMDSGAKETNIRVMSEANNAVEFEHLIIPTRAGVPIWNPITLGSVAKAEAGLADIRRISRLNSRPAVGLGVVKQRGTNAVAVGRKVKAQMLSLKGMLPKGMIMGVVTDATKFIEESTHELLFTLGLSVVLTSIVCYLFLGSVSSAFNVVLAIPTSLIGSFIVLYFCGFTLNTFTLLGLSLSIGIVVDDAIMVLENIVRYKEMGMSNVKAAIVGAREITGAATAASLAILAIFLPVIFMNGIIGKFFFQFGVTMSVAVMLSLLEALTLAPMRCSQFLATGSESRLGRFMDKKMHALSDFYRRVLIWCLSHRWKVLLTSLVLFVSSLFLLGGVPKEFVPPQDQSRFLMNIQTPLGSSMEYTDNIFKQAEAILKARPEMDTYYDAIGGFQGGLVNQGIVFATMKDKKDRTITAPFKHIPTQQEFMPFIRTEFAKIPGISLVTVQDLSLSGFSAQRGFPIEFSIQGPEWEKLAEFGAKIRQKMKESGMMTDIDTNYQLGMPEVRVHPDRKAALGRGVTVGSIANTISAAVGSLKVGRYTDDSGHRDDIRVKLLDRFNQAPKDIGKLQVRNSQGEMVPLSSVVSLEEKSSLLTITRWNRERAVSIFANIVPGKSQADAMAYIEKVSAETLPADYHTVLSGSSQAFKESFQSLMIALALGIFVAYMVLGSQFNSFIHPFTVLLALPFSVTGAFLAMRLTGISLNIYSMIGLLLLMGIVKKNSILLVDFTNMKRLEGLGMKEALLEACPLRLRPILMTSLATVAGAIPAALAFGPGAETTRPMAVVVIGGVLLSTFLTLLVVPCAYSLLSRFEGTKHQKALREAMVSLGELKEIG